jgi:hypothetical protein
MKTQHGPAAALILALLLAAAGPAPAYTLLDGGNLAFTYASFPSGPYGGVFTADGSLLGGVSTGGGVTSVLFQASGVYTLVVVAGVLDPASNVDGAVLLIRSPDPIVPGSYPVDPLNGTCAFAFVDDAVSFAVPTDPASADWQAWFDQLLASRKFVGATGAVTITSVGSERIAGSFSGLSLEYGTNVPIGVSGGTFEVTGALPVEPATWGGVKADYRD